MNDLATISDYVNKIQELYSETFIERRVNCKKDIDNQNETLLMLEQINQDQSIIESLLEICTFLIGTIYARQDEQQEITDHQDRIKKQLEEQLQGEIEEVQQYQKLYKQKCSQVDEQLEAIQDLEQQINFLKNQNTILENQAYQQDKQSIDENITHLLKQQEQQILKAQSYNQELQTNNQKSKQELLDLSLQMTALQEQLKEQKSKAKQTKNELSQLKLLRQQQEALILSLESDLKVHSGIINDQENQIDQLKEQLRQLHNQQFLNSERNDLEKSQYGSQFPSSMQPEKNTRSDSQILTSQQNQINLKVQLPLLSYRQCVYKYRISEVSERYEQSASHSKHETGVPEKYEEVVPFEISNVDESLKMKRLSFQEEKNQDYRKSQENVPQTARIDLGKQVVPKLSITDISNRITVAKKKLSKNCENSNISESMDLLGKSSYPSSVNPYQVFFELLAQCAKLNSEFFDEIYNFDTSSYFAECNKQGVPYFKWQEWIQNRLTQDLK